MLTTKRTPMQRKYKFVFEGGPQDGLIQYESKAFTDYYFDDLAELRYNFLCDDTKRIKVKRHHYHCGMKLEVDGTSETVYFFQYVGVQERE